MLGKTRDNGDGSLLDVARSGGFERAGSSPDRTSTRGVPLLFVAIATLASVKAGDYTWTALSLVLAVTIPAALLVKVPSRVALFASLGLAGFGGYLLAHEINQGQFAVNFAMPFLSFVVYAVGLAVLSTYWSTAPIVMLAGGSAGVIVNLLVFGTQYDNNSFAFLWKYGGGVAFTFILLSVLSSRRGRRADLWACVLLVLISALSLSLGFRSHAVICLLTVFFAILVARGRTRSWLAKVAMGAVGVIAVVAIVPLVAASGVLGAVAVDKFESQAEGVPALLAGRTEPPLSIAAIAASPIVGWGSANNIPPSVFDDAVGLATKLGLSSPSEYMKYWVREGGQVSLHSIALGSWAEGGILAALLPAALIVAAVQAAIGANQYGRLRVLTLYLALQCMWDLLFSPWGYTLITLVCLASWSPRIVRGN